MRRLLTDPELRAHLLAAIADLVPEAKGEGEHPSKIGTQAALPNALVAGSPPGERCITRPMSSSHRPALR